MTVTTNARRRTVQRKLSRKPSPSKINPLKLDPSRTAGLRVRAVAEVRRRFARLRADVWQLLVVEDALGLRDRPVTVNYDPNQPRDSSGRWSLTGGDGGPDIGSEPRERADREIHYLGVKRVVEDTKESWRYKGTVQVKDQDGPEFEKGGVKWREGGRCHLDTGDVVIHSGTAGESVEAVKRLATHEFMHGAFEQTYRRYDFERSMIAKKEQQIAHSYDQAHPESTLGQRARALSEEGLIRASGELKPQYVDDYPTYARLWKYREQVPMEQFVTDDGVSDYSKAYWTDQAVGKVTFHIAVHETLAEMAGLHEITGVIPGSKLYREYYKVVRDEYRVLSGTQKKRRGVGVAKNEEGTFAEHEIFLDGDFKPVNPEKATYVRWWNADGINGWGTRAQPATVNAEGGSNCGTGAGGFQPGNTCGSGGGDWYKGGSHGEPKSLVRASKAMRDAVSSKFLGGPFQRVRSKSSREEMFMARVKVGDDREAVFVVEENGAVSINFGYTSANRSLEDVGERLSRHTLEMGHRMAEVVKALKQNGVPIQFDPSDPRRGRLYQKILERSGIKYDKSTQTWNVEDHLVVNGLWSLLPSADKVRAFGEWLTARARDLFAGLGETLRGVGWLAFRRGAGRAFRESRAGGMLSEEFLRGTEEQFLEQTLRTAPNRELLDVLGDRLEEEVKNGIDSTVEKLKRAVSDAVVRGEISPAALGRELTQIVDKGSASAAETARDEVVRANAEGMVSGFEEQGVVELFPLLEWTVHPELSKSGVCPRCSALKGTVWNITEARGKIPLHRNCKCSWSSIPPNTEPARGPAGRKGVYGRPVQGAILPRIVRETFRGRRGRLPSRLSPVEGGFRPAQNVEGANCGTGAGGFQPGNTCGKGGDVSYLDGKGRFKKGTPVFFTPTGARSRVFEVLKTRYRLKDKSGVMVWATHDQLAFDNDPGYDPKSGGLKK